MALIMIGSLLSISGLVLSWLALRAINKSVDIPDGN